VENYVENFLGFSTIVVENLCGKPALCGKCGKVFHIFCGKLHHCGKLCGNCGKVFPKTCGKVGVWKILGKTMWKIL
jgi:hypothetical protein